jgi:hypothetical protein
VDAYAARAADHVIYEYLAHHDEPEAVDASLQQKLERYFPIDPERLQPYLQLLTGRVGRQWTMQDFETPEMQALTGLMVEFVGYLHHNHEVPYSRAHLAREQMPRYFLDRAVGYLYPREDITAMLRQGRRPRTEPQRHEHPLCPDPLTLKTYLRRLLQTVRPQPYAAAATLGLLPGWLGFLHVRGLLAEPEREQTEQQLRETAREMAPLWQETGDPVLQSLARRWRES